jgi:hypothetical protein
MYEPGDVDGVRELSRHLVGPDAVRDLPGAVQVHGDPLRPDCRGGEEQGRRRHDEER